MNNDGYYVLLFNKSEWLMFYKYGNWLGITLDEIENPDKDGLIGIHNGIKCYLTTNIQLS